MRRWHYLLIFMVACASSGGTTSLVGIVDSPQKFAGQPVSVHGYLAPLGGRPSMTLYLTREHAQTHDVASSIAVFDPTSDEAVTRDCSNIHAVVVGTVARLPGSSRFSRDVLSFAISKVTRVVKVEPETGDSHICWQASPDA